MPRRWLVLPEGPARGRAVIKARAHQPWGTGSPAQALVGASSRACEGACSLQGPRTPAWGHRGSCPGWWSVCPEGLARGAEVIKARAHQPFGDRWSSPGGGRCVMKGLRVGLQSLRPGHTILGGQGVMSRRWSVGPEGLARVVAVIKAHAHQPMGDSVLPSWWLVRHEGPARGAAVSKARAHQPGGIGSHAPPVVGASSRACEGGYSLQGPGTPA